MNATPLHVAACPCTSCPYRRDTPPGVWHAEEYAKLPLYDTNEELATFLCHHSPASGVDTACRGWLTVHCESVAVRLAMLRGTVTPDQVYAEVKEPLYASGAEAAAAGVAGIKTPGREAKKVIKRLSLQQERQRKRENS
jgi:hypothetical protein